MTEKGVSFKLPLERLGPFDPETQTLRALYVDEDLIVLKKSLHTGDFPTYAPRLWGNLQYVRIWNLLHLLNISHATGLLRVSDSAASIKDDPNADPADQYPRKSIYVRNGELIFAQSTLKDDRLGESLMRAGLIDRAQFDEGSKIVIEQKIQFGRVIAHKGWLTSRQLYEAVRRQVTEIVLSLFSWKDAKFVFFEGFPDPKSVLALNLDTRDLLLRGLRATELWRGIPTDTPDADIYLTVEGNPVNMGLNPDERRLLAVVDDGISMRNLIVRTGMGRLNTYKVVQELMDRGLIEPHVVDVGSQRQQIEAVNRAIERLLETFGATIEKVVEMLRLSLQARTNGGYRPADIIRQLNTFFEGETDEETRRVFARVRFDPDGRLDLSPVRENVESVEIEQRRTLLVRTLNELLHFVVFETRNQASKEDSERIMLLIQKMDVV